MASVSSLDQDMRRLRMERVTSEAENEVRTFIEQSLKTRLPEGSLFDSLRNGLILCEYVSSNGFNVERTDRAFRLVNLAIPHPVKPNPNPIHSYQERENISLFLTACQGPDLRLPSHDMFLTVDLYDLKDPAQVLQCLVAFSRAAHAAEPSRFPKPIGGKSRSGTVTPQRTGTPTARGRGVSNANNTSSVYNPSSSTPARTDATADRWGPTKTSTTSPKSVSSWSKKSDEGATAPAWNIAQYGYMGGASQGNLGVSFGGRRQITSAGPHVPSLAEKEKMRKEKEAEEERVRIQSERLRLEEQEAEERRARIAEEQRWAEETRKLREEERLKAEEEKRKWEEEERRWRLEEERRQKEEREAEARLDEERKRVRGKSDARLQGQFLSQYQAENGISRGNSGGPESNRIKELERELELARERERQYERERQAKLNQGSRQAVEDHDLTVRMKEETAKTRSRSRSRPRASSRRDSDEVWRQDERDYIRRNWEAWNQNGDVSVAQPPAKPPRPLPEPSLPVSLKTNNTGPSSRPLPDPTKYASPNEPPQSISSQQNRTDRYLSSNPAPQPAQPRTIYSNEIGGFDSAAERDAEDRRRLASQTKTKAGGWASKSLLEREMEMERQRQQEWEERQKEVKNKVPTGAGVDGIGGGIDGKWDVNQWTGYTGGDGQNRGSQGIGAGRRQIVGPRPPPGR